MEVFHCHFSATRAKVSIITGTLKCCLVENKTYHTQIFEEQFNVGRVELPLSGGCAGVSFYSNYSIPYWKIVIGTLQRDAR